MKKIKVIILFFAVLFLFFGCAEPSENLYSKSDKPKDEKETNNNVACDKEFKEPGFYLWTVPENILGSVTVTIVGGGGGGGGGSITKGGGGGGAGEIVEQEIELIKYETIQITVGNGGQSGAGCTTGNNGQISKIVANSGTFSVNGGSGGGGADFFVNGGGGSGYPGGSTGNWGDGGNGGNNGSGYGYGGSGGSQGVGSYGSNGGSGYVKIEYTLSSK